MTTTGRRWLVIVIGVPVRPTSANSAFRRAFASVLVTVFMPTAIRDGNQPALDLQLLVVLDAAKSATVFGRVVRQRPAVGIAEGEASLSAGADGRGGSDVFLGSRGGGGTAVSGCSQIS